MVILALIIFGLVFGSFVNALVWRLHKQQLASKTKKSKFSSKNLSIINGRSMCVDCGHELAIKDLIPVISWLQLRGKCRYCHKPISPQYPIVELSTVALFVASYLTWPYFQGDTLEIAEAVDFGSWLLVLVGFMALVVYDLRWMLLPNKIVFPLMFIAVANVLFQSVVSFSFEPIILSFWGLLVGGGLFYVLFQISAGRWIGGGDVKLGFLLGIIVGGPALALLMLFLASLIGSLYSVPQLIFGKFSPKSRIAFGPFLITGAIITKLFGQTLIDWYTSYFLI